MRRRLSLLCSSIFLLISLTGCHYRFGHGDLSARYRTVSIPYVVGDQEGELTAELARKISSSGAFTYSFNEGELILKVELLELSDENIGFRYDRKKRGKLKKTIHPTETRLTAIAEVSVIDSCSKEVIKGPTRLIANIEFDHTYYWSRNAVNIFSLGQLSDIDAAHDAAMRPLNRELAEKITDYLISN